MKAIALVLFFFAFFTNNLIPAQAQEGIRIYTYVSRTGVDSDGCGDVTPCATLTRAIEDTHTGRVVLCVDKSHVGGNPASSGAETSLIGKSIVVECDGSVANGITINVGVGEVAIIRGLAVDNSSQPNAIHILGSGTVILDKMRVSSGGTSGILFEPTGAGKLVVTDTNITGNGIFSTTGGGIVVKPQTGGTAQVSLTRVSVAGNVFGIAFDGSASTGGINATVKDSVLSSNGQDGVVATTVAGHAPIAVFVSGSASSNNVYGIRSIGPNVTVRVENSKIIGNGIGVSALSGGALLSAGNNYVQANGNNGVFSGSMPAQ